MKGKKIASILLTLGLAASAVGASALTACKTDKLYTGPKATEFVNKTSEANAKIIYVGTAKGAADGKSIDSPYNFYDFFANNASELTPGTIIKVVPGEHRISNPVRITANGSFDDYIIIEAADPTQDTILNFQDMVFSSTNRGVELYGNYFYWRNIDICGAGDNGLYIGGSYNIIENCEFYNNRDTGLQLGRSYGEYTNIKQWPSYNLIKNCTSYNNYDDATYGENADGFAAKLTVGYGNIFDGCIAYRNSDDGWDLYGKSDTGMIGRVILYNCVAFENGFIQTTQKDYNDWLGSAHDSMFNEANTMSFLTRDGDGNGFKLGGSTLAGDVYVENCLSFNNRMHGVTDNSNPGNISVNGVTSYNNGAQIDNIWYKDIHDKDGNTTFLYTTSATAAGKETAYYNVNHNGYVVDSSNNLVILDETGTWRKDNYVALDEDGYICSNSKTGGQREYFLVGGEKIKGKYVEVDFEASTLNPNFGKINSAASIDMEDRCNNIDIERTDVSYNSFSNVLSVVNGSNFTGNDRYRGSGANSLLNINGKWSKFESAIDTDYLNGKDGTEIDAVAASDIFYELPTNDFGMNDKSADIHEDYRNPDRSINFGNLLKIKDYSKLLGEDNKIGCDLSKSSWEEYPHYDYTFMTDSNYVKNAVQAVTRSVESLIYVQTDLNSCFQNFELITEMLDCTIAWTSSDENILKIGEGIGTGVSKHTVAAVDVTRPAEDTIVQLTAAITSYDGTFTVNKTFDVNVKKITYEIGELEVEGLQGGNVIMSQFDSSGEPSIILKNAADYSGKLVPEGEYEVETKYFFGATKDANKEAIRRFDTSNAGIYEIEKTIKIGNQSKTFNYNIFIVSDESELKFMETAEGDLKMSVAMRHDGFNISGELTNVSGSMYVLVSATQPTAEQVKANGEKVDITWDEISFDFKQDNSAEYDVYFVVCNPKGDVTSPVYKQSILIEEIATEADFQKLVSSGGDSSKIYQLTKDLDFTGVAWKAGSASNGFAGLLDGRGHIVSNIKATPGNSAGKAQASVFANLSGGAIMNINFDQIVLDGKEDVGIIGQAQGGYVYNVNMTNITATGTQRIGALIGHVYEQVNSPLIIDRVTLVNTNPDDAIAGSASRAGGIIGFVQSNNGATGVIDITISNCFVDANIGSENSNENGGIVATYDTDYNNMNVSVKMTVRNCYFVGTVKAASRCGGIVGYHKGLQRLVVFGCINLGNIYHAGGPEPLVTPQKNASGIMGGYASAGDVSISWCYSNISEHNSNYGVELATRELLTTESTWTDNMEFDMDKVWEFVEGANGMIAPYVRLRTVTYD